MADLVETLERNGINFKSVYCIKPFSYIKPMCVIAVAGDGEFGLYNTDLLTFSDGTITEVGKEYLKIAQEVINKIEGLEESLQSNVCFKCMYTAMHYYVELSDHVR